VIFLIFLEIYVYLALKHLHLTAVLVTSVLFTLRGIWMMIDSPQLQRRWVKIVPHVNDTILLFSALALTVVVHQYPFVNAWLTAKLAALVVYIGLGMIALRLGKTRFIKVLAWCGALLTLTYIVAVALTRNPWPLG
jgi:uncharacterized membrane protein SirB2